MFNRSNLLVVLLALCAGLGLWAGRVYYEGRPSAAPLAEADTGADVGSDAAAGNTPAVAAIDPARLRTVHLHAPQDLPDFALQQSDGSALTPDDLRGHWTLVFLGFTHCPDICPTTLSTLKTAQAQWQALPAASRPQVLFVSVDPERDSAQGTGEYAAFFHPDTLAATAPEPALGEFAAAMGLVYMKVPLPGDDYAMDHSAALVLVDPAGRRAGLIQPPLVAADIAADLELLSKEAP